MFVLVRALTYAALFIGFVLVFLPMQVLEWSGIRRPPDFDFLQALGAALVVLGGLLALSCVVSFALIGRGTPAPFDPPRRLVVRGPYRFMRNPMYAGAALALGGAALFYQSAGLAVFTSLFLLMTHIFVRVYEEPTLQRLFGSEYTVYRNRVRRWWPVIKPSKP